MGITEVRSPASSSSRSKVGSAPGIGPGARSNPSRGQRSDQASSGKVTVTEHGEGGSKVTVTGPQEEHGERPQERQSPEE
jgi:hypothetical protein